MKKTKGIAIITLGVITVTPLLILLYAGIKLWIDWHSHYKKAWRMIFDAMFPVGNVDVPGWLVVVLTLCFAILGTLTVGKGMAVFRSRREEI